MKDIKIPDLHSAAAEAIKEVKLFYREHEATHRLPDLSIFGKIEYLAISYLQEAFMKALDKPAAHLCDFDKEMAKASMTARFDDRIIRSEIAAHLAKACFGLEFDRFVLTKASHSGTDDYTVYFF